MRHWLAILMLAIILVSHGGFSGAIAHVEQAHSHETGGSHHAPAPVKKTLEINSLAAESSTSGEVAPNASAHSHVTVGLPETASSIASYLSDRSLPLPGKTAILAGSEAAPLTEPPLA